MRLALATGLLLALAGPAMSASAVLNGVKLSCKAARSVAVLDSVSGYAQADIDRRVIYLGRAELTGMTAGEMRYIMAHECGHILRGPDEYAADGYANRVARATPKLCALTGRCGVAIAAGAADAGASTASRRAYAR